MIERLPLDLFDDEPEQQPTEPQDQIIKQAPAEQPEPEAPVEPVDIQVSGTSEADTAPVMLVRCQWCAEQFDDRLLNCPACGVVHRIASPVGAGTEQTICQWCQASIEPGSNRCPECDAMVVVPGQYVVGENDPDHTLLSRSLAAQRAQSHQLLVGMMVGGGLDGLVAGLIGMAFTLFDDD